MYNVFGSGASHGIYAIFMCQSALANQGRKVGLLRGASTRMATFFYGIWREVRLKHVLQSTIVNNEFRELLKTLRNNSALAGAIRDIECKEYWASMYILLRSLYTPLLALRMCDSNTPMMDKIYFMVHRTTLALEKSKLDLNNPAYFCSAAEFSIDVDFQAEEAQVYGTKKNDDDDESVQSGVNVEEDE
jgi:hypothetical protein